MVQKLVKVLDTTLRDGAQAGRISFSLEDKIKITLALDELGVDYIEAGWPGSNPKDFEFFKAIKNYGLSYAKIAAFGSTRRKKVKVYEDKNIDYILESDVEVAVIFGKSCKSHVHDVLRTSTEENLEMIYDTVAYLRSHGLEVIFDAEHFYQGFKEDPEYTLNVVQTAIEAGANVVVLCDTKGDTLPWEVYDITKNVVSKVKADVGVHMHNDIGCATANTLMGVAGGAKHIQVTINGVGERTGNADLTQVVPTLFYKMGIHVLKGGESIKKLRGISRLVYEILSIDPNPYQPYVGNFAFAHKAGVHVDAILKNPSTYEHIDPELVGNSRKILLSDQSGGANIVANLKDLGLQVDKRDPRVRSALTKIKDLENQGYSFDQAPDSALLVTLKELGYLGEELKPYSWRLHVEPSGLAVAEVGVKSISASSMDVNVLEALSKALSIVVSELYPFLPSIRVSRCYSVMLSQGIFRVTVEVETSFRRLFVQGVSNNMLDAYMRSLVDAYELLLALHRGNLIQRIFIRSTGLEGMVVHK
ncbi:MAG: citramalate synthase [Ignisphaera sp.]|uniref:Citramalate synthase n=1 Tax=Ignisphaera aggregans TaxID=334771 RepID=A0A7C4JJE7_9CREN